MIMFGLNLKELLLCFFVFSAFLKQTWLDNWGKTPNSSVSADTSTTMPAEESGQDPVKLAGTGTVTQDSTNAEDDQSIILNAYRNQLPVVLQNLTNKAAYNGHVGRILNYTQASVLVGVHGAFFGATPSMIWVKTRHFRLLEKRTSGRAVEMGLVTVKASSTRGDFPLHVVLEENDAKWWISAPGSLVSGKGTEYLDFDLGAVAVARVLAISIPPMPMGPLSVREFSVEGFVDHHWIPLTSRLRTIDKAGMQEVALKLVETRRIRLNCFASVAPMDSLGLFQVRLA